MPIYIALILLAYLIGSIPSGLIIGKIGYSIDIREQGSGNLGATNTFRILGKKAGIIVTLADVGKGTLAALLPVIFQQDQLNPLVIGVFAVIGHMYPIFANFRGGKAVATSGGLILGVSPLLFLIIFTSFIIVLLTTKYVSLSSMVTGVVALISTLIMGDYGLILMTLVLVIFIFYRHRSNIKRILNKTEPKAKLF